jgi:beta-phosphoglucomutase
MNKGVIFDMDGVLVDNVRFHVRAWQQLGKEFGKDLSDGEIRRVFGQRNREMIVKLVGRPLSEEEISQYTAHKEEIYREIIAPEIVPAPGLVQLLSGLAEAGIRTAIATSGPMENVEFVLGRLNLGSFFSAIVTGKEVSHGKPAPDIFLLAAERIERAPQDCVVFEDSTAGIEAARRAGIPCIALSTTHPAEELASTAAVRVVPDFRSLRASDILSLQPAVD